MIPAIVVLMMLGLTTAVSSPSVAAQTRPPLAPKSLLTELDQEDRDCVVNNGGLMKNVTVKWIKLTLKINS